MHHELLNNVRLGILLSQKANGQPAGVPIWFDWNGEKIQFFAGCDSTKVKRLENNPAISLLVTNNVGEPEGWVAFDGSAKLCDEGGMALVETLACAIGICRLKKIKPNLTLGSRFLKPL